MTDAPNKQGADRVIETFGARPHQVTVTTRDIRGTRAIVVEWRELGKRRMWKAPATNKREAMAQAKAFAKVKASVLQQRAQASATDYTPPPAKTWSELVSAYIGAEGGDWADNTRRNVAARVKYFTLFFGGTTAAERATLETMLEFRASLRALEHEPAEINRITTTIKAIFAFGVRNDILISKVPLFAAKKIRAHQKKKIPAFSPADVYAILNEMKPRAGVKQNEPQRPWRPWAISLLACQTSKRAKSQILPLLQSDVQWRRGGASVRWRAE
ncbi:MAG TPA: hypothetical protein VE861_13730, partial [Gemmatimonadaceae bacterium]|nr:hypothetical protein [Gemmatimonadaceae bacterium]